MEGSSHVRVPYLLVVNLAVSCLGTIADTLWDGIWKDSSMDDVNKGLNPKAVFDCCHDPY